jgi:phosphonate transport system substrate-binding protein
LPRIAFKRCLRWLAAGWLACACGQAGLAAEPPLRLGIMPFNSALALVRSHQPLRLHLEKALDRPVEIYTSTDYFTYVNELLDGQFDLAIAGPHFGSMAIERGWSPLFRYSATLQPVFVVRKDSAIGSLDDLRGRRIGLSSRLSISSIGGVKWLGDKGLHLDRDYRLDERATHGAAIAAVAVGELDAALTTHTPLKQVPEDIRDKLRILPLAIQVPHLMTLAHPRIGKPGIERLRAALAAFPDSAEGRAFFTDTGYQGYLAISGQDLRTLRPYVDLTVRMMKQHR